ncbi:hypothetical protein NBRC116583_08480 [Arenicella sp. 4NH20-0111]|uniref:hypothetical protein n=1 Tax=Arenicella sp. 4NH20-0111 TaxID=3127648 RepID=UPI0031060503
MYFRTMVVALLVSMGCANAQPVDINTKVSLEYRHFVDSPIHVGQSGRSNSSVSLEPEFYWTSDDGNHSVLFKPFARLDERDDERTHTDVRELLWTYVDDGWELKAGIGKVFWGVTEFQHLVDTINQNDDVEDIDGEDKLGQPMVNLSLAHDWGILDLYLLPYFRERTFPGVDGRLRGSQVIDQNSAVFESSAGKERLDLAVRWSHSFSDYDVGVHFFEGTNRTPVVQFDDDRLTPYYQQMTQIGVDLQATKGDWLLKFEALHRDTSLQDYSAVQAGFEYTFVGVAGSSADIGMLAEYSWDERGDELGGSDFQNDIYVGTRLAFNDTQSTELLIGGGYDIDHEGSKFIVEGSRRLGSNWKAIIEARIFNDNSELAPAFGLRRDDMLQLTIERYF